MEREAILVGLPSGPGLAIPPCLPQSIVCPTGENIHPTRFPGNDGRRPGNLCAANPEPPIPNTGIAVPPFLVDFPILATRVEIAMIGARRVHCQGGAKEEASLMREPPTPV